MSRISWDGIGEKKYSYGVDSVVLYTAGVGNEYDQAEAWNGVTTITENKGGAEATDSFADNIKYASLRAAETYGATIEAFTHPDSFGKCDGTAEITEGVTIGMQSRAVFGLAYRTRSGSDAGTSVGDIIHLAYGLTASPSEVSHTTMNESPELATMSWEATSVPVNVTGHQATSYLEIDTAKIGSVKTKAIEDILYGTADTNGRLPLPDEVKSIIDSAA